jgi:hypothetical protein
VGLTYTAEAKASLQQKKDFLISDCKITLYYTCKPDLSDFYSVKIPTTSIRKKETDSFIVMMLNTANQNNFWQTFSCPMVYPRIEYNWCVTGENKQVRTKYISNFICYQT